MAEEFTSCRDRECAGLYPLQDAPDEGVLDAGGYIRTAHLDIRTREGRFGYLRVFRQRRTPHCVVLAYIQGDGKSGSSAQSLAWGSDSCGFAIAADAEPLPSLNEPQFDSAGETPRSAPTPLMAVEITDETESVWKLPESTQITRNSSK